MLSQTQGTLRVKQQDQGMGWCYLHCMLFRHIFSYSKQSLPDLSDLLLAGNPIEEKCTADGNWVSEIAKKFPTVKKLDSKPIIREEEVDESKD